MDVGIAQFIYYGSFAVFPFLYALWRYRRVVPVWASLLLLVLSISFVWSRFVEPQRLVVKETTIDVGFTGRVALIADLHVGVFKDETFIRRIVDEVNQSDADVLLIAGDLTYAPHRPLKELLVPLKDVKVPVYAVLGNHDVGHPGRAAVRDELREALEALDVRLLENQAVSLTGFLLVGVGSHMAGEDDVTRLNSFRPENNVVVLAHNPDTTRRFPNDMADVTLTGHTHCGQIRIPWLYQFVLPTEGDFDKGLTQEEKTQLYITCGTGEIGLPMRLFNPPAIDLISFR